jgi:hypothetical protein
LAVRLCALRVRLRIRESLKSQPQAAPVIRFGLLDSDVEQEGGVAMATAIESRTETGPLEWFESARLWWDAVSAEMPAGSEGLEGRSTDIGNRE